MTPLIAWILVIIAIFLFAYWLFSTKGWTKASNFAVISIIVVFMAFLYAFSQPGILLISGFVLFVAILCGFLKYINEALKLADQRRAEIRNNPVPRAPFQLLFLFFLPIPFWFAIAFGPTEEIYHASDFLKTFTAMMITLIPVIGQWGASSSTPEKTMLLMSFAWVTLILYSVLHLCYIQFLRASEIDKSREHVFLYLPFRKRLLVFSLALIGVFWMYFYVPDSWVCNTYTKFGCLHISPMGQMIIFSAGTYIGSIFIARSMSDFFDCFSHVFKFLKRGSK